MNYKVEDKVIVDIEKAREVGYIGPSTCTIMALERMFRGGYRIYFKETACCCHEEHIIGLATPLLEELV